MSVRTVTHPPKTGIAITTHNRRDLFDETIAAYKKYGPAEWPIIVVDDGSDIPVPRLDNVTVIRHERPKGIAAAKNRCIAALMDLGVDHLILSDDDCHPTDFDFWRPFVESGKNHLIWQPIGPDGAMYNTIRGKYDPVLEPVYNGERIVAHKAIKPALEFIGNGLFVVEWGAGLFLYFTRHAIETVGGMRHEFGRWSCETWEISARIKNVGLTEHAFVSPYRPALCMIGNKSSVPRKIRDAHRERNWKLFNEYRDSKDFVSFDETPPTDLATVCIPWRPTPERLDAFARCLRFWEHNSYKVIAADSTFHKGVLPPFLCSAARNNAVAQAETPVVIIADADTLPGDIGQIETAINMVTTGEAEVVWPFEEYRHIPADWVAKDDLSRAPIQQHYTNSPGGIVVTTKTAFRKVGGFDEHFTAGLTDAGACWGFDDTAFRIAAETLATVARVPGVVYSFNHLVTPKGRPLRDFSEKNPNYPRFRLYEFAARDPRMMRALVGVNATDKSVKNRNPRFAEWETKLFENDVY